MPASFCTAILVLISVTPAGKKGSCICGMGSLLPQRRLLGNTSRDHSIFIERQDLRGEIRRSGFDFASVLREWEAAGLDIRIQVPGPTWAPEAIPLPAPSWFQRPSSGYILTSVCRETFPAVTEESGAGVGGSGERIRGKRRWLSSTARKIESSAGSLRRKEKGPQRNSSRS